MWLGVYVCQRRIFVVFAGNKSPRNDGITNEMIKHGGPHLIEEIHQLCNKAWETGVAPTEWKKVSFSFAT